jgi:hypothetical protein
MPPPERSGWKTGRMPSGARSAGKVNAAAVVPGICRRPADAGYIAWQSPTRPLSYSAGLRRMSTQSFL